MTQQSTPLLCSTLLLLAASLSGCDDPASDAAPTGTTDGPMECDAAMEGSLVCNPDDLEYLYTADACGNPLEPETRCFAPKTCEEGPTGEAACRCPLTDSLTCRASNSSFANGLYDDTYVVRERACVESSQDIDPEDIVETCDFGSVCFVDDYTEDGHVPRNDGQAFCARSTIDEASPYIEFGCDSVFTEFMRYPTALEVDCRCRTRGVSGSQANGGSGAAPADPANIDPLEGHPKGSVMNCAQPGRVDAHQWPVAYGEGPVLSDFNDGDSSWYGAEFDPNARELYAVVNWSNPDRVNTASIIAWNVDTGDRRIVTGLLPNSVTGLESFGSGYESPAAFNVDARGETQPLTGADTLRRTDDGSLYASGQNEIVRVDPVSGARSLIWKRQHEETTGDISTDYGQCLRPSYLGVQDGLQLEFNSFEVGPEGEFYKGFRDVRGGSGVLRISADGESCEVIGRWNARGDQAPNAEDSVPAPPDVGDGYLPNPITAQVYGMLVHDGDLYMSISGDLVALNLASGERRRIDDSNLPYSAGYTAMHYDPERAIIWTSGSSAAIFGNVVVDPRTGQKELIATDTGREDYPGAALLDSVYPGGGSAANTGGGATSNSNSTQLGGVFVDPLDPDIVYGVSVVGGLLKLELSTFNNYIHSWGQH